VQPRTTRAACELEGRGRGGRRGAGGALWEARGPAIGNGALTVVVVSDYEPGAQKTWTSERQILAALAEQDLGEPFDVLMVENDGARDSVPEDLRRLCPRLEIVFASESQSARLKDFGVWHARTEYVAVLEADCVLNQAWLRVLLYALRRRPDFAVASGRTTYGDETMYRRCLSALDRSFDDLGGPGEMPHVSNNGALYRRAVLAAFPYPETGSPFHSSRLRTRAMVAEGHRLWFEPGAVMRHAIGGLDFIRDFRRNTGYADMNDEPERRAPLVPRLLWRRLRHDWKNCRRVGPAYLRRGDWPLLILLLALTPFFEVPGVIDALRGRPSVPNSSYR
jgi:hypothetical protein